ncbi:MAG: ribosomal protein S18-alanine N-acetyltransferase [Halobacteriaceae archaeon]
MTHVPNAETPAGVDVRPVVRADLLAVFQIEKQSFPQPWPFTAFERFLDEPGFLVAAEGEGPDTTVLGYVVADTVPTHGRDVGHVKDLAVHPRRRGEGLGRSLLARALAVLRDQGATTVKLEVRVGNDAARSLYRSFGFEFDRRVARYYEDGEDALVLVRDL